MTNIYIDSDVIVASEIEEEEHHHESREFMQYVLRNKKTDIIFFTSVFTFLELASAMIRRTNDRDKTYSLLYRIRNSWKYSINPLPPIAPRKMTSFTRLVDTLIETSIRFHTTSGDSMHAQTISENKIDYVITWNKKHFSEVMKQIGNLKVLTPPEIMQELKK
jgi:predicted nucleic acid-binding protein